MNKSLCLALLLLAASAGYSQVSIKGKVIDASTNQPIAGVNISVVHQPVNTATDKTGSFVLTTASVHDSLLLTSIGYRTKAIVPAVLELYISMEPSFANLNEIIVTGSREVQRRTEVPVAVNVISKSTIDDTKASRLDLLINKAPGVYMVDLGNEQHEMAVRQPLGTKNLFLYLEDGIPIRTVGDFNHNALIEINQASVERIEVVKGPASSLYGSEAVGGAINFITQAPSSFFTGKLQAEVGSRGYRRTDFNISNSYKKLGIYLGGYYANQNQQAEDHNDFTKAALTLRADYNFSERTKLSTVADYIAYKTDQKGGLDSAHFYNKDYSSFYRFTYRKVDALRVRSTLTKAWNDFQQTSFTVFYRQSAIGQNPFYSISNITASKAKGQVNEDAFNSYGAILQHTSKLGLRNAKLISGLSIDYSPATYIAHYTDVDRSATGVYFNYTLRDSALTDYKVDLVNTAVYTQLEYKATEKMKFVAAARYDRLDYRFDNHLAPGAFTGAPDATDHFDHITPKLGLTYDFEKGRGAYLNYSVGFAPPNISDLYAGVKVPVLKAASYNNYEVGGWITFAGSKGYAEASLYKLDGKNEIVSTRLADGSYINQNAGKTSHKGVEANIKYAPLADVSIRLGGSYAKHRYITYIELGKDYSGRTMAQAPPVIYNGEITYKPHYCKGLRIAVEVQGMNRYFTDPQNTATYKGFTTLNARAGYTISHVEIWMNCINLTDRVFATVVEKSAFGTSYRPGQLRTINVGLAYNFKHK